MLHEITRCEVCNGTTLTSVLDLGKHPMCDDLVPVGNTRQCVEYPIEILFCATCRTAHQRFQIPKQELFPQEYHYRARHTGDVLKGMRELVEACTETFGDLAGRSVLDIGCNDGSLLSIFREQRAKTYGIEPTGAFQDARDNGHTVLHAYFTKQVAEEFVATLGQPDIITFTNVFAHIENLAEVIAALKVLCHPATTIVIENHYLGAVLEKFQFDTFYHEHPRTYSYTSFARIGEALGMRIGQVGFPARYNGNIRVFYVPAASEKAPGDPAKSGHAGWAENFAREAAFGQGLKEMNAKLAPWRERKHAEIAAAVAQHGPLRAKAFPGRAAIPVKLLGLDTNILRETYEKPQSGKIGHYLPGTRIPIVSDDAFDLADQTSPVLNLAWHIAPEIHGYLRVRGFNGPIIDLISPADLA